MDLVTNADVDQLEPAPTQSPGFACDAIEPLTACATDCCTPRWTARAGAIFLQRSRSDATPIVVDLNTGSTVLAASSFGFPAQAGADIGLLRHGRCIDVDFRYFGVQQVESSLESFVAGPGLALATAGAAGGSQNALTLSPAAAFSLHSVELNFRRNLSPSCSLLSGVRYVSLRDRIAILADDNVALSTTNVSIGSRNDLIGWQIGADGTLWDCGGKFRVEGALKAGVFADCASSNLSITDLSTFAIEWQGKRQHTAFVGDLNVSGVYQLNSCWSLRAGYQLLWLEGIAVAGEQLSGISFNSSNATTDVAHGAFLHGATLSLERCW